MPFLRAALLAWLLALLSAAAQAPAPPRALPLHRPQASRAAASEAGGYYRMGIALGDDYFDGTDPEARVLRHLRAARAAGARYLRCAFSWNGIEPAQGHYRWRFWDRLVELAAQQGITLIPYVAYTPEWAAAKKEKFWQQPPRDPALYAGFMRTLAARYRGRIHSWEIWNEPDLPEYWQGSAGQFAALVKLAAPAIREGDPEAVLVLGGMSLGPSPFFRELLEQHHVERSVDVLAVHAYPESWHEARIEMAFEDVIAPMARLASTAGLDLWLNEMGYPDYRYARDKASVYGVHVYYRHEHTRQFQAVALFRMFTLALSAGKLSLAGWYRIDDFPHRDTRPGTDLVNHHLGLLDERGRSKPDLQALRLFTRLFDAPTRPLNLPVRGCRSAQCVVSVIERKDGRIAVVGWLRSPEQDEVAPTGDSVDRRRETVDVTVPCTELRAPATFSVTGKRLANRARFARGQVLGIPLTGDGIFIAQFTCVRD